MHVLGLVCTLLPFRAGNLAQVDVAGVFAGAQRLSTHLEEALHDLAEVRQQENDLLKRRVALCHQELDGQVAQLERSFHLKVLQASYLHSYVMQITRLPPHSHGS